MLGQLIIPGTSTPFVIIPGMLLSMWSMYCTCDSDFIYQLMLWSLPKPAVVYTCKQISGQQPRLVHGDQTCLQTLNTKQHSGSYELRVEKANAMWT
eukprot:scaffold77553_cov17-Tisochrysis_lutea.AAC.1